MSDVNSEWLDLGYLSNSSNNNNSFNKETTMPKPRNHEVYGPSITHKILNPYEGYPTFTLQCFDTKDGNLAYELNQMDRIPNSKQFRQTTVAEGVSFNPAFEKQTHDLNLFLLVTEITLPKNTEQLAEMTTEQREFMESHAENVYRVAYAKLRAPHTPGYVKPESKPRVAKAKTKPEKAVEIAIAEPPPAPKAPERPKHRFVHPISTRSEARQ